MSVLYMPEPIGSPSAPLSHAGASLVVRGILQLFRFGNSAVRPIFRAITESRFRRAARELHRLDDRMLRDIGIARLDIDRVVRYARDQDECPKGRVRDEV